jgi:hypothetical protein
VLGWWATLAVGLAVLLLGRRLFWVFVGAAGFAVGLQAARAVLGPEPEWLAVLLALALGVVGALLALVLQWVAVGIGGFLAGVYAGLALGHLLGLEGRWLGAAVIAAGIAAAALLLGLWDWVLIGLSALTGAALLVSLVDLPPRAAAVAFVALIAVGVVVQGRLPPAEPPGLVPGARRRRA